LDLTVAFVVRTIHQTTIGRLSATRGKLPRLSLTTLAGTVHGLAIDRMQLASSYYIYSISHLVVGSLSRVALSSGGVPATQECVECRCVVLTPAARKPHDQFESHEHPTCAFSQRTYIPANFHLRSSRQIKNINIKKQSKNTTVAARSKCDRTLSPKMKYAYHTYFYPRM
jgi:hypothetical protein